LKAALDELPGYRFRYLDNHASLLADLRAQRPSFVFNLCDEGLNNDAFMELHVPAYLEMLGVPYTASKMLALAVTLDKAMTKRVLTYHGLPTPAFQEFRHPDEPLNAALQARLDAGGALFVKPNREGTGKGIYQDALVRSAAEVRERVAAAGLDYENGDGLLVRDPWSPSRS